MRRGGRKTRGSAPTPRKTKAVDPLAWILKQPILAKRHICTTAKGIPRCTRCYLRLDKGGPLNCDGMPAGITINPPFSQDAHP